jgi:hypothetical protein
MFKMIKDWTTVLSKKEGSESRRPKKYCGSDGSGTLIIAKDVYFLLQRNERSGRVPHPLQQISFMSAES